MSRAVTMLSVGLAASVAVNIYLIVTRPSGGERSGPPTAVSSTETRVIAAPRQPDPARGALEARLAQTEAELDKHRPLAEKFELAERAPEVEAQVKPFLDKIFPPGAKPGYTIECHGRVCKLEADADRDNWMEPLQHDPDGRGLFHGMTFDRYATYLDVEPPEVVGGNRYLRSIFDLVRYSPDLERCKKEFPHPGKLDVQATLDAARHVVVQLGGELASTDIAACVRGVIDAVVASLPLPADVSSLPDTAMTIEVF